MDSLYNLRELGDNGSTPNDPSKSQAFYKTGVVSVGLGLALMALPIFIHPIADKPILSNRSKLISELESMDKTIQRYDEIRNVINSQLTEINNQIKHDKISLGLFFGIPGFSTVCLGSYVLSRN